MMHTTCKISLYAIIAAIIIATTPVSLAPDVTPIQQLFVIKELKPDLERIGILWNESAVDTGTLLPQIQRAGASTGIQVIIANVAEMKDIAPTYRMLVRDNDVQALWIISDDGTVDSDIGRSYLIKNATQQGIPIFAPTELWVNEGASVAFKKVENVVALVVNQAAANALSLTIPEKYLERTQFLAMN